jgi:AraC-like DNA-binding protein
MTMTEIQSYILTRLNGPIHLREVAQHFHLTVSGLRKLFHRMHGYQIGKMIRTMRVNKAALRLVSSNAEIKQIASECGFTSGSAFCRAFKQSTGQTPISYRHRTWQLKSVGK